MSRDLNKATPRVRDFANKLILEAKRVLNIDVFVVEVDRPYEVQVAYYAQGRDSLTAVNKLRKRAGLPPINASRNKKITWTMNSKHITNLENDTASDNLSRAIDFGIKDKMGRYDGSSKADTNKDNKADYKQLGIIGKMIDPGMIWGGDWKTPDMPHWEEPSSPFEGGESGGGGAARTFETKPVTEADLDSVTAKDDVKI